MIWNKSCFWMKNLRYQNTTLTTQYLQHWKSAVRMYALSVIPGKPYNHNKCHQVLWFFQSLLSTRQAFIIWVLPFTWRHDRIYLPRVQVEQVDKLSAKSGLHMRKFSWRLRCTLACPLLHYFERRRLYSTSSSGLQRIFKYLLWEFTMCNNLHVRLLKYRVNEHYTYNIIEY